MFKYALHNYFTSSGDTQGLVYDPGSQIQYQPHAYCHIQNKILAFWLISISWFKNNSLF
jgi:hypothetical protein